MSSRSGPLALVALGVLLTAGVPAAQEITNRDQSGYTRIEAQGFPVKSGLEFMAADEAALGDDDMVLGVVIAGEARAFPINLMWKPENEVLNDTVGGAPIAATW